MESNNPKNLTGQTTSEKKKSQPIQPQASSTMPADNAGQISSNTQVPHVQPDANHVAGAPIQPSTQQSVAQPPQMPEGVQAPPPSMPERIRRDFSFAQVLASVFSTVTCMVLAPKIGLLGGLLGAAIGAGVAAVASQVYKSILYNTSDKIKYKQQLIMAHAHRKQAKGNKDAHKQDVSTLTGQMKAIAEDSLINTMEVAAQMTQEPPSDASSPSPNMATAQQQSAQDTPINAQDEAQKSQIWKYVLVIAGVTMLSVALSVGVINYLTKGEGWGKKPEVVYITKYVTPKDDGATSPSNQNTNTDSSSDKQKDADKNNQNAQSDSKDSQGKDGQSQNQDQKPQDGSNQQEGQKPTDDKQPSTPEGKDDSQKSVQAAKEQQSTHKNS